LQNICEKFYQWGYKHGLKLSSYGRKKIGVENWENFENNLTGSFIAYAQGFKDGADSDD